MIRAVFGCSGGDNGSGGVKGGRSGGSYRSSRNCDSRGSYSGSGDSSGVNLDRLSITGHAGYAHSGQDIVCAAVSSAVQLTANLLTENFGLPAEIAAEDNLIFIGRGRTGERDLDTFYRVMEGLRTHLQLIAENYPGTIKITYTEV